jgi:hypothetical protein
VDYYHNGQQGIKDREVLKEMEKGPTGYWIPYSTTFMAAKPWKGISYPVIF